MARPVVQAQVVFSRSEIPKEVILVDWFRDFRQEVFLVAAVDNGPHPIDVALVSRLPFFRGQQLNSLEEPRISGFLGMGRDHIWLRHGFGGVCQF